ncbi:MAG TPA: zinc transporter ZupT [Phycisphaerae bacterium]|nr:zinc transporter ZupT [Phycisphaerae bacterium]
MDNVLIAAGLTLFAGLSTGIGSAIAFLAPKTNYRFLSVATGFSAGVMLYVSFTEILKKASEGFAAGLGEAGANWATAGAFFGGIAAMFCIDFLIPTAENPHEVRSDRQVEELHFRGHESSDPVHQRKLLRMGLLTALAIGIHNFPEGLATFLAALQNPAMGAAIAVAIALHNIPEGISVSVPIYYATGDRRKAFVWSLLSGLAEPIGAIIGYLVLRPILSPSLMGGLFAGVAGIMVYISLDELLPTSRAYGKGHDSLFGLMGGMLVMALSLLLMQ